MRVPFGAGQATNGLPADSHPRRKGTPPFTILWVLMPPECESGAICLFFSIFPRFCIP